MHRATSPGLAPFTIRIFRLVWLASVVSNIGGWMQSVGAQWFLVESGSSPALIALVQTASAAPVILLAIPAGVLGERLNRRRVLVYTQITQLTVVIILTVMTWQGAMSSAGILLVTLILGVISAIQLPAYESLIPDIVPRAMISDAAALSSTGVNIARAIGPAIAGLVVAKLGPGAVFALNALSFLFLLLVLILWRGYRPAPVRAEPFLDATRAGLRYVRHSAIVRSILIRFAVFLLPATALWALLPVVVSSTLGLNAGGYGLLLTALGVGSILGAIVLSRARERLGVNATVGWATGVYGIGLVSVILVPTIWIAVPALVVTGAAWLGVVATVNATIQAFLPAWVRTRGLSIYQLAFYAPTAVSAIVLGILAEHLGSGLVMAVAGAAAVALAVSHLIWRLPETRGIGRDIVPIPGGPLDHLDDEDEAVLILITYTVASASREKFRLAMHDVEQSRLRTGARSWTLYRDPSDAGRLVEAYVVGSWREHLSQHEARITEYDGDLLERVRSLSEQEPTVQHLVTFGRRHHRPRHTSDADAAPPS